MVFCCPLRASYFGSVYLILPVLSGSAGRSGYRSVANGGPSGPHVESFLAVDSASFGSLSAWLFIVFSGPAGGRGGGVVASCVLLLDPLSSPFHDTYECHILGVGADIFFSAIPPPCVSPSRCAAMLDEFHAGDAGSKAPLGSSWC
ncbi:hypothetical protein Dimus_005867 [Dionaea muscipula]